jgi:hypothetical protein
MLRTTGNSPIGKARFNTTLLIAAAGLVAVIAATIATVGVIVAFLWFITRAFNGAP